MMASEKSVIIPPSVHFFLSIKALKILLDKILLDNKISVFLIRD